MPKGYWIAHNEVHDPETYRQYLAAAGRAFEKFGARFLVRGGRCEVTDGTMRPRHIVIEFADYATALACHESPEYQEAMKIRRSASASDHVIVEGSEP